MPSYDDLDALIDDLVEAAIDADMYERGFAWKDGNKYTNAALQSDVYRGEPERNDTSPSADLDYESLVFNFWPGEIEKYFAAWRASVIPDPADFQSQIDALRDCARPIGLPSLIEPPSVLRKTAFPGGGGGMSGLVEGLSGDTAKLKGSWANAFHRQFVVPLPYVLGNQAAMLDLLSACIETEAEMWKQVRQSVADLAEAGAGWFRHTMHYGNVWEIVVEVGKAMYTVFELRRAKDPVEVGQGVLDLIGSADELNSLLATNPPPDPRETGIPNDVQGVRVKIAQTLEYTINKHIIHVEEQVQTLLRASVKSMQQSRETFVMGDAQLGRVREASQVLAPEQVLTERGVDRTVKSLYQLGDQVTGAASGIITSVYPFVRPGSLGIGSSGPYDSVLTLENLISDAMHDTAFTLERAATSVRIAPDYVFAADSDTDQAMTRANERLDKAHDRFAESIRPPGRGESPYTPPNEELHVEVDPCLPGEDPFADAPKEPWRAPMAPQTS